MSRFEYSRSYSTTASATACDEAAEKALSETGCKKIGYRQFGPERKFEYFGTVGMGWVFRLIGGILAPATLFPVRLLVSVADNRVAREITVTAAEDFGFGTLFGIEKKMRMRCDDLAAQMVEDLAAHLSRLAA